MYLMPKRGKPLRSAADLRPIALLSPFAKILARLAAKRLRPYVQAAVKRLPLFAYIEGRQAGDALDRVMSHCANVRSLTKRSYIARAKGGARQSSAASWRPEPTVTRPEVATMRLPSGLDGEP